MTRTIANSENPQPGLFDQTEPSAVLTPKQEAQLATLVEALLIEIAATLASREAGHEQDHR